MAGIHECPLVQQYSDDHHLCSLYSYILFLCYYLNHVSTWTLILVPLAGTIQRLLEIVLHDGGIAGAVEWDGAGLQSALTAALTEPGMTVDVEVEYGGRGTFAITRIHCNLEEEEVTQCVNVILKIDLIYCLKWTRFTLQHLSCFSPVRCSCSHLFWW